MYSDNEAPEGDVRRAFAPLVKACRGGFCEGCRQLEYLYPVLRDGSAGPKDPGMAERIPGILERAEPCRRRLRAETDREDPPLGDEPGSTRIRDRWVAKVNDKWAGLPARFDAAETVARMGFPELVAPMLERRAVHETLERMEALQRTIEHAEHELLHSHGPDPVVARPSADDVERLAARALRDARYPDDAWGRPLRVRILPGDSRYQPWDVEVLSDGPDGEPHTEDDISTSEPYGAYDERRYPGMDPAPGDTPPNDV
jgi:hypothetical protein